MTCHLQIRPLAMTITAAAWLSTTAGVLGSHARKSTLKFAVPKSQQRWWERLWTKIASPYPNCNAVGPAPPFASD